MGLAKLDLTEATIKDPPATIETTVVVGSAEIMVPENWKVKVSIRTILGGVLSDDGEADINDDELPDLALKGKVVIGGLAMAGAAIEAGRQAVAWLNMRSNRGT